MRERELSEFEMNLDCEIRFHSVEGDGVTARDAALAEHMERAMKDFWRREELAAAWARSLALQSADGSDRDA